MNRQLVTPKRHTSYYYDYMQEIRPWLTERLPEKDRICVENELWNAIQESTEGTHDATAYLDFDCLESYLEDEIPDDCLDRIMALFRELTNESDTEGINIEISW